MWKVTILSALVGVALAQPYIVQLQSNTTFTQFLQSHSSNELEAQEIAASVQRIIKIGPYEWLVMDIGNRESAQAVKHDPLVKSIEPNMNVYLMPYVDFGSVEDDDFATEDDYTAAEGDAIAEGNVNAENDTEFSDDVGVESERADEFEQEDHEKDEEEVKYDDSLYFEEYEASEESDDIESASILPENIADPHEITLKIQGEAGYDSSVAVVSEFEKGEEQIAKSEEVEEQPEQENTGKVQPGETNIQYNAPSHLARISTRDSIWNVTESDYEYKFDSCGEGIVAYVIDTGVAIDHPELEGRARWGYSTVLSEDDTDKNGHGTHVAGLIASKTFGSAKCVDIVAVKVLAADGSGTIDWILQGLEFAVNDCKASVKKCVINMSLGSFYMAALNQACDAVVDEGIPMIVAAGNSGTSSSFASPASAEKVIAVGAMDDWSDSLTTFTNWGEKVAVFAPGYFVESLDVKNFDIPVRYSGTSMASPIAAGVACLLVEGGVPTQEIKEVMISKATEGALKKSLNRWKYITTLDRLLYSGASTGDNTISKENPRPFISSPVNVPGQLSLDDPSNDPWLGPLPRQAGEQANV